MKTILIAEDDPVMRRLLEFTLRRAGYATVQVPDGPSAEIAARENPPALAILDFLLPGRSGLELLQVFRQEEALADLPVIIVTGQGRGNLRDDLLAAGACRVFTKPFSPATLLQAIGELLAEKGPAGA